MHSKLRCAAAMLLCLLLIPAISAQAAKHALLIGVGDYPYLPPGKSLEGPPHDVAALSELLRTIHGFPADHIVSLVDEQATRTAVLAELERLVDRVESGDLVMIYFSGHGTSCNEYGAWTFDSRTGALLPYDFKMSEDVEKMMDHLIIGRRDIRPVLKRLDNKSPRVLAVFDACYSGYTIRSTRKSAARSRFVSIPSLKSLAGDQKPDKSGADAAKEPEYPYRHVVYMSAASSEEQAWDITRGLIWGGHKTFDGKPHGAMTDALLRGVSGDADTNGDGDVTWNELYHFTKSAVTEGFAQTPQLLCAKGSAALLDGPLFRTETNRQAKSIQRAPPSTDKGLKVRLEGMRPIIRKAVAEMAGVTVVDDGPYDLLITPRKMKKRAVARLVNFYLPNGSLLDRVPLRSVVDRIRRHTGAGRLIAHTYPESDFNVFLELIDPKGVLVEDDPVGFVVRSEARAHILLIDIDSTGGINVLYPYMPEELKPVQTGQTLRLPELGYVTPPHFGVEHLKVFAFKEKPPGLENFMGESFPPDSPLFEQLMELIDVGKGQAAQAVLPVRTAARSDVVKTEGSEDK